MAAPSEDNSDDPIARYRRDERERAVAKQWHRVAGVGIEFVVAVLLAGGLGWWLDTKFGTSPWLLLVGLALGFATGLFMMIRAARRLFHD